MMNLYIRKAEQFEKFAVNEENDHLTIRGSKKSYEIDVQPLNDNVFSILLNNQSYIVEAQKKDGGWEIVLNQDRYLILVLSERQKIEAEILGGDDTAESEGGIYAPMPGLILLIEVKKGQKIKAGQPLLIMEAMKMENEIKADVAGIVEDILVEEKQKVEKDDLLLKIS
jgi:pyruvate carboxylase subunit B